MTEHAETGRIVDDIAVFFSHPYDRHRLMRHTRSRPSINTLNVAAIIDGNAGTVRYLGVVLESLGKLAPDHADGGIELANSDTCERIARLAQSLLDR